MLPPVTYNVALLPGDGLGPQLAVQARRVLDQIQTVRRHITFHVSEHKFGGAALASNCDTALPDETLESCRRSDAVIVCGCGNSQYGNEPEKGLLALRQQLGAYANIRPVTFPSASLADQSSFRAEKVKHLDIVFVRDLTAGVYYGPRTEATDTNDQMASDTTIYSKSTIERLARWAGSYAIQFNPPKPVHSVDKNNVMATSRLWRSVVSDIFAREFPLVALHHVLVDTASMLLSSDPTSLNGIILSENMFGDILSDQAGGILPSPHLLASAAISTMPGRGRRRRRRRRQHKSVNNTGNQSSSGAEEELPPCYPGIYEPLNLKAAHGDDDPLVVVNPLDIIQAIGLMLEFSLGGALSREARALSKAVRRTLDPIELIGSEMRTPDLGGASSSDDLMDKFLVNLDFYLEAVNSEDLILAREEEEEEEKKRRSAAVIPRPSPSPSTTIPPSPSPPPPPSRRPMGIIEKIILHSAVGLSSPSSHSSLPPIIIPGTTMLCVKVSWTITSELLWAGMEKTYSLMGRPRLHRNDRLWLAIDHTVDPRSNHLPLQKSLIKGAESFRDEAKIVDFLPANTSIMHTDFTRDRAQPGRIVVGSDSHTCSAGSMGSFAIGFGAADVVMPMVTGDTWLRVPEVCRIDFVGELPFGVGGKEIILHILGLFRRNTIAFQKAVEYGGEGLGNLSMDARFAIANMTTEFGGMGACFEADERTRRWVEGRPHEEHGKNGGGLYFRADEGCEYAERREIDLGDVGWTVALYPNPDDVVPVKDKVGMKLDGCFIGACTTTYEDLVLGALVLEAGLKAGMVPMTTTTTTERKIQRRVTPGSLSIVKDLERHGLLDIYHRCGFGVGAPGCSYCVGINDVDVAGVGEVWLSSQNRNFHNRMGKGSLGNVTSAAVVAASSFAMEVTDPRKLMDEFLDREKLGRILGDDERLAAGRSRSQAISVDDAPHFDEPAPDLVDHSTPEADQKTQSQMTTATPSQMMKQVLSSPSMGENGGGEKRIIRSKIQRFGENVDTDAIIPAEFMPGVDNADLGSHCFQWFRPEFRQRAKDGARVVVADSGWGSGSSREDAVRALLGCDIQVVIAKSFAFIYERNQLNMGLYNIKMTDPEFYANAHENSVIIIDKDNKTVSIEGLEDRVFPYSLSDIEETLLDAGGVLPLYTQYGTDVFRHVTTPRHVRSTRRMVGRQPGSKGRTNMPVQVAVGGLDSW